MRARDIDNELASINRLKRRLVELDSHIENAKVRFDQLTARKQTSEEKNRSFREEERLSAECKEKIEEVRRDPRNRSFAFFLNKKGKEEVEKIQCYYNGQIIMARRPEIHISQMFLRSDEKRLRKAEADLSILPRMKEQCSCDLERRLAAQKDYREKLENIKARAAENEQQTRNIGSSLIKRLVKTHKCPYCFQPLGDNPHVDHIHPVSKGGQSRAKNMAWVCSRCNLLKKDMTLREFIIKCGLNRQEIEERLTLLKKEF